MKFMWISCIILFWHSAAALPHPVRPAFPVALAEQWGQPGVHILPQFKVWAQLCRSQWRDSESWQWTCHHRQSKWIILLTSEWTFFWQPCNAFACYNNCWDYDCSCLVPGTLKIMFLVISEDKGLHVQMDKVDPNPRVWLDTTSYCSNFRRFSCTVLNHSEIIRAAYNVSLNQFLSISPTY